MLGAGIWRDAALVSYDRLEIADLCVRPAVYGDHAQAGISVEVANHTGEMVDAVLSLAVTGPDTEEHREVRASIPPEGATLEATVVIEKARLWWPSGFGEQPLYTAAADLGAGGETLDTRTRRFGLRTVELRTEDDAGKPAFFFLVNGQPVYARGSNWVPADFFVSRVAENRYRDLLRLAKDAHFNMLRVWGGGIYERPEFYDLCDELGLMLWQDFMFALADYPETPDYMALVQEEARSVVRRLRGHPSVVLWCGNNECRMDLPARCDWFGKRYFFETIPDTVEEMDGTRLYWPSSPFGGDIPSSGEEGDFHGEPMFKCAASMFPTWGIGIGSEIGQFMSEFPTLEAVELPTLKRLIPEDRLFPPEDDPVWNLHLWNNAWNNAHREKKQGFSGQELLMNAIRKCLGEPEDAEEFCRRGGLIQGEFLAAQLGYYRRHKFGIGGSLLWMFNDAWPSVDYGIVDYYLRPKAAYWFAKRVYAPVVLLLEKEAHTRNVGAWVVNDRPERVRGTVRLYRVLLRGDMEEMEPVPFDLPPNGAAQVWSGPPARDPAREVLFGRLERDGEVVSRARHVFTAFKDVAWPEPRLSVETGWAEDALHVTVGTDACSYAVALEGLPDSARPEDNYFNMLPGETRTIRITGVSEPDAKALRAVAGL